jgi:hypothetical protein
LLLEEEQAARSNKGRSRNNRKGVIQVQLFLSEGPRIQINQRRDNEYLNHFKLLGVEFKVTCSLRFRVIFSEFKPNVCKITGIFWAVR